MKKLLTLILCASFAVSASALTLENAADAFEATEETAADLAYAENLGKPGYNLWTGTTDPYTFEGNPAIGSNASYEINVDWSNTELDSTTDTGNTSIKLSGDNPRFSVTSAFPAFDSDSRTFTLLFDAKTETTGDMSFRVRPNRPGKWQYVNNVAKDCRAGMIYVNMKNYAGGDWVSLNFTLNPDGFTDNDAPLTDYTKVESFWLGLAGGFGSTALWIDNVSIIPNYKVSYDLGEGSGTLADEFFYADSYNIQASPALITAPSDKVFSHWVDQNGNPVTDTVTPVLGEDIVLTAVYTDKTGDEIFVGNPGVNLWTGTTEPYTFDGVTIGDNASAVADINRDWSSIALDTTTEPGNTFLKMTGDNPRFSVNNAFPTFDASDRVFTLIYDAKTAYDGTSVLRIRPNRPGKWQYVDNVAKNCLGGIISVNHLSTGGEWEHVVREVNPDGFTDNDAPLTDFTKINSFWIGLVGAYGDNAFNIDNVSIIPNYKITYEGVGIDWYLLDESGSIADTYTPKTDNLPESFVENGVLYHCAGWGLHPLATESETSIPLNHEDITLYPVWEILPAEPVTMDEVNIRVANPSGIRFNAFISAALAENADEYGFLAARASQLTKNDGSDLVFPEGFVSATQDDVTLVGTTPSGTKFVCRAAFSDEYGYNRFSPTEYNGEAGMRITGVLVGFSGKEQYQELMAARPYLVIGENTFYGSVVKSDVYTVAKANEHLGLEAIREIIEACEN